MAHTLERTQLLPIPLEEAWEFFSTPRNLERITPKSMGLRIVEPFDDTLAHTGQLIEYRVRPLLGIPLKWLTRLEEVQAPFKFVDIQLEGPYRLWRHEHTFTAVPQGVEMCDRVEYELPMGPLGEMAHSLWVKAELARIFDHRETVLASLFKRRMNTDHTTGVQHP